MVSWGEPEHMTKPEYCTRPNVDTCRECCLTSYNKDCMNQPLPEDGADQD